jgi:2'-5' RNA ligase
MTETQFDVIDSREVIEEDWHLFRQLDRMRNHWDRPGWTAGRRAYYWYLTFDGVSELEDLAAMCQRAISSPHFDLVPTDELHMTIDRVGFMDEVSESSIQAIEDAAERECQLLVPFACALGPLAGSAGAARFSATPWVPIFELRDVLRRATRSILPHALPDEGPFRPHVGIGYSNTAAPAGPVIRAVESVRQFPSVTTVVTSAALVSLERQERAWLWDIRRKVELRGRSA